LLPGTQRPSRSCATSPDNEKTLSPLKDSPN
jgi:hypothetical protein